MGNTWHRAACSCVTPASTTPLVPVGPRARNHRHLQQKQLCPRGLMPSCSGRCPQTRAGDRPAGRGQRDPSGSVHPVCHGGGSSGSRGRPCWGFHHPPHAAPNSLVLFWDKGRLVAAPRPRCPSLGAARTGWERLCGAAGAGGTVPGRSHGGAGRRERGGRPSRLLTKQGSPEGDCPETTERQEQSISIGRLRPRSPAGASLPAAPGSRPPGRVPLPTRPRQRERPPEVPGVMAGFGVTQER